MSLDIDCFDDVHAFGLELDDPIVVLEQDVFHMLIERPGSNLDDIERGVGLIEALSGKVDPSLASRIDAQLRKDDRIDSSRTTISKLSDDTYLINIRIEFDAEVMNLVFGFDGTTFARVS